MIHDKKAGYFGILGHVINNPRTRLSHYVQLLPDGGNVAMIGFMDNKTLHGDYTNFGAKNWVANSDTLNFFASRESNKSFAKTTERAQGSPNGQKAMHLEGRTPSYIWDLIAWQDWTSRPTVSPRAVSANDMGRLPNELWTVDILWPRSRIKGTITYLPTSKIYNIDAHGYRENSWGRYDVVTDGWDFYVFSEAAEDLAAKGQNEGVSLVVQTYHKSKQSDYTDVGFLDNGVPTTQRFWSKNGEMTIQHNNWFWSEDANQCVPIETQIALENATYRVNITAKMPPTHQTTLLSHITLPVGLYFIQDLFPEFTGEIIRKADGHTITTFQGGGAGEFSYAKAPTPISLSPTTCSIWGRAFDKLFPVNGPSL